MAIMIGIIPKEPSKGRIRAKVIGTDGVPYNSLANQSAPPELVKPKRIRTKKTAPLNTKQKKAVNNAIECISKVAPSFSSLYNSFVEYQGIYELDFKTIESKDLLGELKDSRDYDGKTIYLNKDFRSKIFFFELWLD